MAAYSSTWSSARVSEGNEGERREGMRGERREKEGGKRQV